eukprot:1161858-Pelagomonas_calceolata.AAC.5
MSTTVHRATGRKEKKSYVGRGNSPYINSGKGDTLAQKSRESPRPRVAQARLSLPCLLQASAPLIPTHKQATSQRAAPLASHSIPSPWAATLTSHSQMSLQVETPLIPHLNASKPPRETSPTSHLNCGPLDSKPHFLLTNKPPGLDTSHSFP